MADHRIIRKVLDTIPQQQPFRFIDEISEMDSTHIVGSYTFRPDEFFYHGHFPGNPITPGVILVEAMAQVSVVAFGIYLVMEEMKLPAERVAEITTLFSLMENVEFLKPVFPGEKVTVRGEKIYFRRLNLKVQALMEKSDGTPVCMGTMTGTGVRL
jgi:3-hydroxyacyl-[acyl-carrier-protein] dehydratase